jgi:hypothetical protein
MIKKSATTILEDYHQQHDADLSFFLGLDLFKKRIRFMFKDEDLKLNTMVETEIFQRGATIKKI